MVPRLALHVANLLDDVSDSFEVAAVAIGSPVDDVELCELLGLPRLGGGEGGGVAYEPKTLPLSVCGGFSKY